MQIRSRSPWTSPAFIAEMKVNVYSILIVMLLVAMAVYCPYTVSHSFIRYLLSTYYVSANRPGMEKEDEINLLQGDQNLVRMNRHVHN